MKLDKINATQIIIAALSCPLIVTTVVRTWRVHPAVCVLIFLYLALFLFYVFHPWRCMQWSEPGITDAEQKRMALHFRSRMRAAHSVFFVCLVVIPILCSVLLLAEATLPDYTNDIVVQSFARQEYKNALDTKAVSLNTPDTSRTAPGLSFVASLQSSKGIGYPTSPFLSLLLRTLFNPIWGLAWSALVWIIVFLIGVWFAEFIGGITFHFKQ